MDPRGRPHPACLHRWSAVWWTDIHLDLTFLLFLYNPAQCDYRRLFTPTVSIPGRNTRFSCPSVCLSLCLVRAPNSKTKKRKKTKTSKRRTSRVHVYCRLAARAPASSPAHCTPDTVQRTGTILDKGRPHTCSDVNKTLLSRPRPRPRPP